MGSSVWSCPGLLSSLSALRAQMIGFSCPGFSGRIGAVRRPDRRGACRGRFGGRLVCVAFERLLEGEDVPAGDHRRRPFPPAAHHLGHRRTRALTTSRSNDIQGAARRTGHANRALGLSSALAVAQLNAAVSGCPLVRRQSRSRVGGAPSQHSRSDLGPEESTTARPAGDCFCWPSRSAPTSAARCSWSSNGKSQIPVAAYSCNASASSSRGP